MRPLECVETIVVHHSASRLTTTPEEIRHWHVDERGWEDTGYHFILSKEGVIHRGRHTVWQGAHVRSHNAGSIGVCLVGNNVDPEQRWTPKQIQALLRLVSALRIIYGFVPCVMHKDLDPTTLCPGIERSVFLNMLKPISLHGEQ